MEEQQKPELKKTTVRLCLSCAEHLRRVEAEAGISHRALFEALVRNCERIGILHAEGRLTQVEFDTLKAHWEAARRIDAKARSLHHREPRVAIPIDVTDEIRESAKRICRARGVSVNALVAAAVSPWGSGWGTPEMYEVRRGWWKWIEATGRRLDHERRSRAPKE